MAQNETSTTRDVDRAAGPPAAADNRCAGEGAGAASRLPCILALALNAALIAWIVLSPAQGLSQRLPVAAGNVLAPLIALACSLPLALPFAAVPFRRGSGAVLNKSRRLSAVAFSLAFLSFTAAQCAWYYYELLREQPPFPSWADVGYLAAYPFLIIGVLTLPARPLGAMQRGRVVMDSLMTIAATATFSWYFLLGPTLLALSQSPLEKVLAAAYPVADLLVLFCLLLTVARARGARPEPGLLPLCVGLLVIVVTDVVFGYQALYNAYTPGTLLDAGWPLGYSLLAVGARRVLLSRPDPQAEPYRDGDPVPAGIETMLPYALVPMVAALVVGTLHERSGQLLAGVYVGSAAIVVLIVLRQVLTIRQNSRLYAELSLAYSELATSLQSLEGANATLAHAEERFRAAAESASDLIYEVNFDNGRLEWFGDVARHREVSGVSLPPTLSAWEEMIHPDDRARVVGAFKRHVEEGERFDAEYRVAAANGQYRYWTDRGRVTRRNGAVAVRAVGAVSDVTERKHAEALERERVALRQAVSAMEGVLGVVGHELRTPLAGLRAMSEFLLTDGASASADAEQMLSGINEEVVRMSETVNDLLEAARLNSGLAKWRWSTFNLRDVAAEAIDPVRPLVDESAVTLECDVDAGLSMNGDADAIRRLVLNLLSNARKFTSQGRITVTALASRRDDEQWVDVQVSDTGAGIPPEIRDRLGEAFALNAGLVGANHVTGTGLGLAICKGIAAAHGGSLSIRSEIGRGTTVTARLRTDLKGPTTELGKTVPAATATAVTAAASAPGPSAT